MIDEFEGLTHESKVFRINIANRQQYAVGLKVSASMYLGAEVASTKAWACLGELAAKPAGIWLEWMTDSGRVNPEKFERGLIALLNKKYQLPGNIPEPINTIIATAITRAMACAARDLAVFYGRVPDESEREWEEFLSEYNSGKIIFERTDA